jgi:sulfate transport system permease protein
VLQLKMVFKMNRHRHILPGFGLALGMTVFWLGLFVLLPMAVIIFKTMQIGFSEFLSSAFTDRAIAAYKLSCGASFISACVNAVFGTILAWVLCRYRFRWYRVFDALIDFPFALPTAVAGLTLSNLFVQNGWLGRFLVPLGIHGAFSRLGVIVALIFVSLPFVVRTLQPIIENLEPELEEAAATLGAGRIRTMIYVILPHLLPGILTGFSLALARSIGEYGSIVFISGNIPYKTEIAPVLIMMRLEEYNYTGAMAIAVVLLFISFCLLTLVNAIEIWSSKFQTEQ